jgi:hypothetical protein
VPPPAQEHDLAPPALSGVEPNPSAAKTIGVLNIVFGACLLLCGLCFGLYMTAAAAMGPMMAVQQQQVQQQMQQAAETQRQEELKELQKREKASKDEKEKAELQARQKALQVPQPVPKLPDMTQFMRDARFQGYWLTDVGTGLLLNLVMLVTGIGLVGLKEWGRVTGLWVAALKILRLIVLYSFYALVIAPVMVQQFKAMMEEMTKAVPPGGKAPRPEELGQMATVMGAMTTGTAIGMIILGAIYPVVVLIVLTRPRVKAACAAPPPDLDRQSGAAREMPPPDDPGIRWP